MISENLEFSFCCGEECYGLQYSSMWAGFELLLLCLVSYVSVVMCQVWCQVGGAKVKVLTK